ncbi:hypothetical protein FJZ40_00810 [Candidatus Shapirobacteria bacterium]|nr:hypothetical protein [Candidatus Shapirobacteria bacterium]
MNRFLKTPLVFFFFSLILSVSIVGAVSEDECREKQKEDIYKGRACWEELVAETQKKANSLTAEIAKFNASIALTLAKIQETETAVKRLEGEIEVLGAKINRLDISLNQLSAILATRVVQTYKRGDIDPLSLFLSSANFSSFLSRYKYLRVTQAHDKKLLLSMQETKTNFEDQKALKEEKQKQLEKLKKVLETQKKTLADQKKDREYLLAVTRSDEKKFQELLAAARAEQSAIEAAMRAGMALLKNGTPVEVGKEIALVGNTGYPRCSTGPHLHLEVRQDGEAKNPAEYLTNIAVEYDPGPVGRMSFAGSWPWPVESPTITQEYGMSYWARLGWYRGGPHTGIDITSENPVIRAPKAGTLYRGQSSCGGVGLNFVAIDHGGGLISWYWHVQ